jgi:hypothetical protein
MADLFELDDQTLATVQQGIDSLIHQLGKWCKIIYEFDKVQCNNCLFDSSAQKSSGRYNGVGPKPFQGGRCPVCHGTGYIPGGGTRSDIVQFLIDWQPKPWLFLGPNSTELAKIPRGLVQTKGFVTDLPKARQAKYLIVDYANASPDSSNRYALWGEPLITGNIARNRYFVAFWQRIGN